MLAQKMSEEIAPPVVVENRAGANGILGTEYVAKSAPDGYTLILGVSDPRDQSKLVPEASLRPGTRLCADHPRFKHGERFGLASIGEGEDT